MLIFSLRWGWQSGHVVVISRKINEYRLKPGILLPALKPKIFWNEPVGQISVFVGERYFSRWHFDYQCLACGRPIIQTGKLTNWAPHPKALCASKSWWREHKIFTWLPTWLQRMTNVWLWFRGSPRQLPCVFLYKEREHRGCVRKLGCSHYVKFWGISRGHYKPLTIFTPLKIQTAIFPVNTPAFRRQDARGGPREHMVVWHACPQRDSGLGKTRENKCRNGIKSLFNTFHSEIKTLLIYFTRRVHFQARARIGPGGVLCSPPHPIILKASFLSKWHANGPLFPLLRSSITAVWWKRLSGCCWWTFISCEELISPEQTMPLVSIQILFLTNQEKASLQVVTWRLIEAYLLYSATKGR